MQENCRLQPAKPFTEVEKVYKRLQKRSKVVFLFAKKKADIKEMLTNNSKAKDSEKE
jgi:hypothetical protein